MSNFVKQVLTPVIGFGLGGLLWGWQIYSFVGSENFNSSPFSYILGAVFMGVLGSGSLVLFSGGWKKILKLTILGTVAWIVAFMISRIWEYPFSIWGSIILSIIFSIFGNISLDLGLRPSLMVGIWIVFLLAGVIISVVYSLLLKTRLIKMIIFGSFGLALASIVSPVAGNLVGNLLNSLFAVYLVTFTLIGVIFGSALVWGLRSNAEET